MGRKENRITKGLSVRLCFRPSSVPLKAGDCITRLSSTVSVMNIIVSTRYETEWDKHTRLVIKDCSFPRGKELRVIRKNTE